MCETVGCPACGYTTLQVDADNILTCPHCTEEEALDSPEAVLYGGGAALVAEGCRAWVSATPLGGDGP